MGNTEHSQITKRTRAGEARVEGTDKLAMNVAADGDRASNWLYIGFFHEDLSSLKEYEHGAYMSVPEGKEHQ